MRIPALHRRKSEPESGLRLSIFRGAILLAVVSAALSPTSLAAQTGRTLEKHQKDVREHLAEAKRQMEILSGRLAESEPEDADRLQRARARIIEQLLESEMADAEKALAEENYGRARAKIGEVVRSMQEIVAILENRTLTPAELERKLEELRQRTERVKDLANQERNLRDLTKGVEDAAKDVESIGAAEQEVNRLRSEQQQLSAEESGAESDSVRGAEELERLRAEAQAQQQSLGAQAARDRIAAQLAQARAKIAGLQENAQSAAAQASKRREAAAGDAARISKDAELREIARRDTERAAEEEALAATLEDLRRQAEAEKYGEVALGQQMDAAKKALGEAAKAARESGAARTAPEPGGEVADAAQAAEAAEAAALAEAGKRLAEMLAGAGGERRAPEMKDLAARMQDLAQRFGAWKSERGNIPDEASASRAAAIQEALAKANRAQANAADAAAKMSGSQDAAPAPGHESASASGGDSEPKGAEPGATTPETPGTQEKIAQQSGVAAERMAEAARKMGDLAGSLGESRPSAQQEELAARAEELTKQLEGLEKKVARDQDKGAAEEERLRKKIKEAREALARAESAMRKAASSMRNQDAAGARKSQALSERELEAASKALAETKPDALERLKRKESELAKIEEQQRKLERLARKAAEEMKEQDPELASSIERAAGDMGQASEELAQKQSRRAREEQEEALAQLEQEAKKLEEEQLALANLKQEQDLIDLLSTVEEMIEEQGLVRSDTGALNAKLAGAAPRRTEKLELKILAGREKTLLDKGSQVKTKLDEENSLVFGFVMQDLLADVDQAREALSPGNDSGEYTQFLQAEALAKLEKLKQALEEEIRRRRDNAPAPPQQQASSGQQRPRLVPPVAELLMLRKMQQEVADRTRTIDRQRSLREGRNLDSIEERVLERLGQQQGRIVKITDEISKLLSPPEQPGPNSGPKPDGEK